MTVLSSTWAAHIADQHTCCWVVGDDRCGLWCGHDGDHLPYTPGDYLAEPTLHPLDLLLPWQMRLPGAAHCPICGTADRTWGLCFSVEYGLIARQVGDEIHLSTEGIWRFEPCGCVGREILPDQEKAATDADAPA